MTLKPQIALFAALLAALGGSPEDGETSEFRKATIGLQQITHEPQELDRPPEGWCYQVEHIDPSAK